MNEDLSKLVQQEEEAPMVFSETDLDLPENTEPQLDETEAAAASTEEEEKPEAESVEIVTLGDWFEANSENFDNINQVKVSIRGVNPDSTLIMAIKDGTEELDETGESKRNLRVFDNADIQPIINLKGVDMQIYNNGFRAVCEYVDGIYIKCYGVRTGMIAVFCNLIDGLLVPYNVTKVKKTDTSVNIVRSSAMEITVKLNGPINLEDLQLRYKQSSKAVDGMNTIKDSVAWLLERQDEIYDINHHLQIDNVIIETLE